MPKHIKHDIDKYWENKIKQVVNISKEHGFPEQDIEFWNHQPCGVISLIIDICSNVDKTSIKK